MDWIINDELGVTVGHVVGWAAASAMVIGGVIPYVPQYIEIKKTQDAEGFSLYVCLALLIANSLRILFWFSSRYELPLLVQSVVMNVTMFLMIHLCVKVKRVNANNRDHALRGDELHLPKVMTDTDTGASVSTDTGGSALKRVRSRHYLNDLDFKYFWSWTDFQSYLDFMLVVWAVGAAVTYLMLSVHWFMEAMGFVAVFTEAMLGAPQFLRNFKNKSTYGMSIHMVIMWTLGDMFKTGYFIVRNAPSQFWICGTLQVILQFAPEEQPQHMHPHDLHASHSEEHQLSLPVTVSSSGDDHLLTARADDEHFKVLDFGQCHDNRAFQYHNNNKMLPRPGGSGKSKDDSSMAGALEVVIVHSPASSKEQRLIGSGQEVMSNSNCCRRKRNNSTQTRMEGGGSCCCVITTHHHHCHCNHRRQQQQHQQHHHHHHHHHCNYRSTKRRALLHQKRHHSHQNRDTKPSSNHNQMLPNKSSLDSSEEGMRPHPHQQAIAIEIDAATMSEDGDGNNSSTATSNFPYKVASEGVKPIIMAPLREQHHHRRGSLNSNTTIETDELSHDEDDDDVQMGGSQQLPEDEAHLTQPPNTNSSSSSAKRGAPASAPARNECVRIKRKRFMADACQGYCSSCSSSCSCSSLDEDRHEMTVAAECHQCNSVARRASYCSCPNSTCCCGSCSQEEAEDADEDDDDDDEEEADDEDDDETTGQRESFCTAADHTITPSQEGDDMHSSTLTPLSTHRSSFVDQGDHTMRSDNIGGGNLTDADASSLSQSAEYFSLSSTAGGGGASFPIQEPEAKPKPKTEKQAVPTEQPSCKHWNPSHPHTKHKRSSVSLVAWPAIDVNALLQQTIRKSAVLQETPVRRKGTASASVSAKASSNDSSTATLTPSVVTVAKYPGPGSGTGPGSGAGLVSTVTSLNGCGSTTYSTAPLIGSGSSKRNSKYSPLPGSEVYQHDPLQQSSTEIIL
ncbi:hypothetical protein KR018_010384 [Drosophila ironensis]|nr:hypothetical protein KR018_010384 [Drosophila ironensis]